ncbi:MAG TPA: hypothetical protein VGM56_10995 [Byssovorax sp.]
MTFTRTAPQFSGAERDGVAFYRAVAADLRDVPPGPHGDGADIRARALPALRRVFTLARDGASWPRLRDALFRLEFATYGRPASGRDGRATWGQHLAREERERAERRFAALWSAAPRRAA